MKNIVWVVTLLMLFSCGQETKIDAVDTEPLETTPDTVIVKHKNVLNQSYEVGFYANAYSYHWITGKDTLDFRLTARDYVTDSTFHISISHKQPLLFTTALKRIDECLRLIEEDFDLSKLRYLHFKSPMFYLDLTKGLSNEYVQNFGRKYVGYQRLQQFLLASNTNTQLNNLLRPLHKKVSRYGIEKFQLIDRKKQPLYALDTATIKYPDFFIDGMGLSIYLTSL
jgi:hypothetical protein